MASQKTLSRGKMKGGYNPTFFDHYRINLNNGRTMNFSPRIGRPEMDYINKGVHSVNINTGTTRPDSLPRVNHATFLHPDYLQAYVGGSKPLAQFSREECRGAVQAYWDSRNGVGFITSGAQEARYDGDPWAQLYTVAPDQYIWIEEKWGELAAANPGTINPGCYDGNAIFTVHQFSEAQIRQAVSSPANAHAFCVQYESAYCPHFKREMWRYKPVLLNAYHRGAVTTDDRHAELLLTFQIVKLALQHVGADPEYGTPFFFLGKTEFTQYSTRFSRPLPGGGRLESSTFPEYSYEWQLDLCHESFVHFKHPFAWEDTRQASLSTDIVPDDETRYDGFALIKTYDANPPRASIPTSPYSQAKTYPCLHTPASAEDMFGLAALWYQKENAVVNEPYAPVRFRQPGGDWQETGSAFIYECWKNRRPYVRAATSGSNYKIKISDYVNIYQAENTIEVQLSTGSIVPVTYYTGGPTVVTGTI